MLKFCKSVLCLSPLSSVTVAGRKLLMGGPLLGKIVSYSGSELLLQELLQVSTGMGLQPLLLSGAWRSLSAAHTQGLFIAILTVAGVLKTVTDGKNLQNFLICVEMLPAALGMLCAFPYTEYKGAGARPACSRRAH